MTDKEIENWKSKIDSMSHIELAHLQRFAPIGHPVYDYRLPLYGYFSNRFDSLGGMTPEISKRLGWDQH